MIQHPRPWACDCPSPRVYDSALVQFCPDCGASPSSASLRLFRPEELADIADEAFARGVIAGLNAQLGSAARAPEARSA